MKNILTGLILITIILMQLIITGKIEENKIFVIAIVIVQTVSWIGDTCLMDVSRSFKIVSSVLLAVAIGVIILCYIFLR